LRAGILAISPDKNVLQLEDMVDTGLTLKFLMDYIMSLSPKTVKVGTMLSKHGRRKVKIHIAKMPAMNSKLGIKLVTGLTMPATIGICRKSMN